MKRIAGTIVLLLCILILAGGCDSNMKKTKYQKLELRSFTIETGGGMDGGRRVLQVCLDQKSGIAAVYKSVNDVWYLHPRAESYVVDPALLEEIKQIIVDEKLYNAPKAPLSEMQALDAPTTSYHVSFSEGEFFSYSSSQALSSRICNANDKIKAVIEESCGRATACPTIAVPAEGEYTFWKEQERISIDCSNDASFRLSLNIYNGTGDKAELTGSVSLSRLDGDNVVDTETLLENQRVEVYAGSQESISVTLPFDHYPEEGTYKMEYAGYETIFEMKVYKIE